MPDLLQETREFNNERAALNFILRLRELYGRKAKCYLRCLNMKAYVKYRIPADGKKIPNSGTVISQSPPVHRSTPWN